MEKYEYKLLKYVCSKFLCLRLILIFIFYFFYVYLFYFFFFFSVHRYFKLFNYSIFYRITLETFEDKKLKFMD